MHPEMNDTILSAAGLPDSAQLLAGQIDQPAADGGAGPTPHAGATLDRLTAHTDPWAEIGRAHV